MTQGPNVKRLIAHKMSLIMVPPGGGVGAAIGAMLIPGKLGQVAREATLWVEEAIYIVKAAPDNPYKTDEEIAGEIMRQVEARQKELRHGR